MRVQKHEQVTADGTAEDLSLPPLVTGTNCNMPACLPLACPLSRLIFSIQPTEGPGIDLISTGIAFFVVVFQFNLKIEERQLLLTPGCSLKIVCSSELGQSG